jgi:hypothetical protein
MIQRLNLKTVRYDRLSDAVLMDGRNVVVVIARDALEAFSNRVLAPEEAVGKAVEEATRLSRLAEIVPADDGRVLITKERLLNNGRYGTSFEEGHGSS